MPRSHLSKRGRAVQAGFTRQYGAGRGRRIFYATMQGAKATTRKKLFTKGSRLRKGK